MKIYIGPYKNWIGPYQLVEVLKFVGVSENRRASLGDYLVNTWVNSACKWIYNKRQRKVKIKLHPYDTWNTDATLAIIILPLLKQLFENSKGTPIIDDCDVPEELRLDAKQTTEYGIDVHYQERWKHVSDKLIWTFEQLQPDCDWEAQFYKNGFDKLGWKAYNNKIKEGLALFGKYYLTLWD